MSNLKAALTTSSHKKVESVNLNFK